MRGRDGRRRGHDALVIDFCNHVTANPEDIYRLCSDRLGDGMPGQDIHASLGALQSNLQQASFRCYGTGIRSWWS